jgi:uncharacterized protein YdaU (DUF1376 family)
VNFYEHHISDYQRKTAHLSLAEHGAYSLMLQAFYATERPLPAEPKVLYRLLRADSAAERKAVDSVVRQFWTSGPDGLTNPRADEVLEKYKRWLSQQKANGSRGGRPPKTQGLTQTKPNGGDHAHAGARVLTSHLDLDKDLDTHPPQPLPGREGRVRGERKRYGDDEPKTSWRPPSEEDIRAGK